MGHDFVGIGFDAESPPPVGISPPKVQLDPVLVGAQFTTSGYGEFIPLIYGSYIVEGNVFWQSAWKQNTYVNKTTKPATTIVTNYCDFAVGICEGEIDDVLRIWVNDVLIFDKRVDVDENDEPEPRPGKRRAVTNQWGVTTYLPLADDVNADEEISVGLTSAFLVCKGGEYQLPPDKMIAEEGYEFTPGYRGLAYILFTNYFQNDTREPTVRIEVVANSQARVARLFTEYPDNGLWDDVNRRLVFDPTLSVIYSVAESATNSGPDNGFISINVMNMETVADHQFYDYVTGFTFAGADIPRPETLCLPIFGGNLLIGGYDANDGFLFTASPWANAGFNLILRDAGGLDHADSGPTAPGQGAITFQHVEADDTLVTAVAVPAFVNGLNHIGFASIDQNSRITWRGYLNGVLAQDEGGLGARTVAHFFALTVDEELADKYPTFPDTARTQGQHVYAFTVYTDTVNSQSLAFHVDRVTVRDPPPITAAEILTAETDAASLDNPKHTYIGEIDLDQIGGHGVVHEIIHSFVDPVDNTFVLTLGIANSYDPFPDYIIKWSPWTGQLVYAKPLAATLPTDSCPANANIVFGTDRKWAYPSPQDKIVLVDLVTGDSEVVVEDTVAEGIGAVSASNVNSNAVWLGDEGALILPLDDALGNPNLVKVWVTRRGAAKAALRTVVTDLLRRAGWDPALTQYTVDIDEVLVTGYVVLAKKDVRAALSELKQVFGFDVVESSGAIQYIPRGGAPVATIPYDHLKQDDNGSLIEVIDTDIARLRKVSIKYFDIARDYAENVQQIVLPEIGAADFSAEGYIDVDVPLVLTADEAKILAEGLAYQKQVYETNYQFSLPPKYLTLDPGDVIEVDDDGTLLEMRVRNTDRGADKEIRIEAVTEDSDIYNDTIELFTEAGRFETQELPDGNPVVFFTPFQIPHINNTAARIADSTIEYRMFYFDMNPVGEDVTFERRWELYEDDVKFAVTNLTPDRPTWGYVQQTVNIFGGLYGYDTESELIVRLVEEGSQPLTSVSGGLAALAADSMRNLAYLNGELIQFADVVENPDGSFTLTNLLRALHGTEIPAKTHGGGGLFILIADETGALAAPSTFGVQNFDIDDGPLKRVRAALLADDASPLQPDVNFTYEPTNFKPFAPTSPTAVDTAGDLVVAWQRRERFFVGEEWPEDGDEDADIQVRDASLTGDYTTRWDLWVTDAPWDGYAPPPAFLRTVTVSDAETWTYTAAMQTADGVDISADTLYLYVRHSGGKTGLETGWPCKFTFEPGV